AKHLSWKYYTPPVCCDGGGQWSAFDAIQAVRYSPEWATNVVSPSTAIFGDISSSSLPAMSWVIPDAAESDHLWSPTTPDYGPSWVASVVNAIGESRYWDSTAIIIVWDDWGGLYDHVAPPQLDYLGLGFRVPMMVVSPYARRHYVSHTQYEFGSILKFIEDNWNLGRLGTTDVRANSIADAFNFAQSPRKFVPIPATYSTSFFLRERPSDRPVDTQ
ncbi:MAG TPA: alkaline phosphatase family protein, partial [Candidatus Baltobacteraceae bacterium]|nr:alkaline phosphatase family protein [Candidatus Baltobacteraceae bacterium]